MTDTIQALEAKLTEFREAGERWQSRYADATQRAQEAAADALLLPEGPERFQAEQLAEAAQRDAAGSLRQVEAHAGAVAVLQRRLETARTAEALAARAQRDRELLVKLDAAEVAMRRATGTIAAAGQHIAQAMEAMRDVAAAAPEAPLGMAFAQLRGKLAEHIRREVPQFIELVNEISPFAPPDPSTEVCTVLTSELRRAGLLSTVKVKD